MEDTTFMRLYRNQEVSADDIDDFIDQWHESASLLTLPEFLGMTHDEYVYFVRTSEVPK